MEHHTSLENNQISQEALEQKLCKACGFCCDGTLFLNVRIKDSEPIQKYKEAGLRISKSQDGSTLMKQPCSGFRHGSCQTYECRPMRCGEFRCALLKRASINALSEPEALELIQRTKKLRNQYTDVLLKIFPQFESKALASHYRDIRKASKTLSGEALKAYRSRKSELKDYKTVLQEALDTHFYNSDERKGSDSSKST